MAVSTRELQIGLSLSAPPYQGWAGESKKRHLSIVAYMESPLVELGTARGEPCVNAGVAGSRCLAES
jgi:hypothetical protein